MKKLSLAETEQTPWQMNQKSRKTSDMHAVNRELTSNKTPTNKILESKLKLKKKRVRRRGSNMKP